MIISIDPLSLSFGAVGSRLGNPAYTSNGNNNESLGDSMDMDQGARAWLARTARKNYWRVSDWYDLDDLIQDGYWHWYRIINKYPYITKPRMTRNARRIIMGLFQRTYTNHLHDLAKRRCPTTFDDFPAAAISVTTSHVQAADAIMDKDSVKPKNWRRKPDYIADRDRLAWEIAVEEETKIDRNSRVQIECRIGDLVPEGSTEDAFVDSLVQDSADMADFMILLAEAPEPVKRVLEVFASEDGRRSIRSPRPIHRDETMNERLCRIIGHDPDRTDLVAWVENYFNGKYHSLKPS